MEVVLFGDIKQLKSTFDLLEKSDEVDKVTVFRNSLEMQKYIGSHPVDLAVLDADNEDAGWEILNRKIKSTNSLAGVVLLSCNEAAAVRAF